MQINIKDLQNRTVQSINAFAAKAEVELEIKRKKEQEEKKKQQKKANRIIAANNGEQFCIEWNKSKYEFQKSLKQNGLTQKDVDECPF